MQEEYARLCGEILNAVLAAKDGRRPISQVFKSLPDRNSFAEYYTIIPEPMSLDAVKTGLADKKFKSPSEFFKDLHLVFLNAKYYNEESSQIWKDAKTLEDLIHELYNAKTDEGLLPPATPIKTKPYKAQSGAVKATAPKAALALPPVVSPVPPVKPLAAKLEAPAPAPAPTPTTTITTTTTTPTTPGGLKLTRPRGRPPKGKILDEGSGQYIDPPPGTILPAAPPPKPRMPSSTGSFSHHGGGGTFGGNYGHSMGPPSYNTSALPAFATPGPSGSSKQTSDRPTRGPPEPGELMPTEITRQLPVPPLNDPRELSTIETQERIRNEADLHLPRWTGPEETLPEDAVGPSKGEGEDAGARGLGGIVGAGWWGDSKEGNWYPQRDATEPGDWQTRAILIVEVLDRYKDIHNNRIAKALGKLPEETNLTFLSFSYPISLPMITQRVKSRSYPTMRAFDMEMTSLFEKGRRYYEAGSKEYGDILALQRLYNSLTSSHEPNTFLPAGPDPSIAPSKICFAGCPAGPGRARVMPENGRMNWDAKQFTSPRASTSTKDKVFTAEARSKGMAYRIGDFIHLINPDDPTRPIIGHIFKTYTYTKGTPCHMVSVCWYFRSEQIIHTADRTFYKNEAFKSSHYVDHPVEDILEKVGCQFATKYSRGRPPPPEWYPGWPLYVCVSRYNERERQCVKIKNWNSCIPEELRKSNFNPPVPFEQAPHSLRLLASPFITGGPNSLGPGATGGIIDGIMQRSPPRTGPEDDDDEERPSKRQRKDRGGTSTPMPSGGEVHAVPPHLPSPLQEMSQATHSSHYPGYGSPMPGPAHPYPILAPAPPAFAPGHLPMLQPPGGYMLGLQLPPSSPYRHVPSPGPQHVTVSVAPSTPGSSQYAPPHPSHPLQVSTPPPLPARNMPERGLATAVGGPDRLLRLNDLQQIPSATLEMVEKDPVSGHMYWFSGPPLDHPIPQQPTHSPAYLHYLSIIRLLDPVIEPPPTHPQLSYGTKSNGALMTLAQTEMDTAKLLEDIDGLAGIGRPRSGASGSAQGTTSLAGASATATGMEEDDGEQRRDTGISRQMAERLCDFLEAMS